MGPSRLDYRDLPAGVPAALHPGVIRAHPLTLTAARALDPVRPPALTRDFIDAGASGLAVAVDAARSGLRQAGGLEPVLSFQAVRNASRRLRARPAAREPGR